MTAIEPQPYEIRLVVDTHDDRHTARWIAPDAPESETFPLLLPLKSGDADELRWYLETYIQFPGAGDHARARGVETRLAGWGTALFEAAFGSRAGQNVYRHTAS